MSSQQILKAIIPAFPKHRNVFIKKQPIPKRVGKGCHKGLQYDTNQTTTAFIDNFLQGFL